MNNMDLDIREEEKRLYEEYKSKLAMIKKVKEEREAVGQVFTKGLLPIYVLYILSQEPSNGNDISNKIGYKTEGMWNPSTGGIYPLLKRFEKEGFIVGQWDDPKKKNQRIYTLTEKGIKEFDEKKELLKVKMQEALEVFNIVYRDLYES